VSSAASLRRGPRSPRLRLPPGGAGAPQGRESWRRQLQRPPPPSRLLLTSTLSSKLCSLGTSVCPLLRAGGLRGALTLDVASVCHGLAITLLHSASSSAFCRVSSCAQLLPPHAPIALTSCRALARPRVAPREVQREASQARLWIAALETAFLCAADAGTWQAQGPGCGLRASSAKPAVRSRQARESGGTQTASLDRGPRRAHPVRILA